MTPKAEEKTYLVSGYLTISVFKEIRATSIEEARKKAEVLSTPGLCYHCDKAGEGDDDTWELNGFDDPPDDCVKYVEEQK